MTRVTLRWLARGSCRHPEFATLQGGSLCPVQFPAMLGVITHPARGTFLFDTGYDPEFMAATTTFPERLYRWTTPVTLGLHSGWQEWLAAHAIAESTLAGTILSHFHGDHVAGMAHLAHLPMHCARAGLERLRKGNRLAATRQGLLPALVPPQADAMARFFEDAPAVSLPSAFAPFSEGRDILGDGSLLAVELPGHCPGHWGLALQLEDGRDVLLVGDAVWSARAIQQHRPPPRLVTTLLGDTSLYRGTLARLHQARTGNADLVMLPSHCAASAAAFGGTLAD